MNQVRSKAELLELYNEYQQDKDLRTNAEWIRYLKLSPSTFSKWQKNIPPKLPKYTPTKNTTEIYEPKTEKNDTSYDLAFAEIADKLDMDLNQVKECYQSAMQKIKKEIKDKEYDTLRQALNECEAGVVDSVF